ncbi:MAG: neutral/alkaline non-lysosomal ceramidase N-terminal domain-containing protein [Gemmatimonadetes bacterium]|nr:neutral/alkaline non-lysosomal ceramidase N-terminal domain-containing protein [Gemmatimonadota bacterium]
MINVGFGSAALDLPPGLPLGGYLNRAGLATGTHDPITATAAVFGTPPDACAIVAVDLVAITEELALGVRDALRDEGFGHQAVLLAATHTHSGPGGNEERLPGGFGYFREPITAALVGAVRNAVRGATASRVPATLLASNGPVDGIASNRFFGGARARSVAAIAEARDESGRTLGLIVNYAVHPTVLAEDNLEYSADFVAAVRGALSVRVGGAAVLYLNGAAGDLSTRGVRRSSTFEEAERLGRLLASQLEPLLERATPVSDSPMRTHAIDLSVEARELPTPSQAESLVASLAERLEMVRADSGHAGVELRGAENDLVGARVAAAMARQMRGAHRDLRLHGLRIGDLLFLGIPAELFSELGEKIRRRSPAPYCYVVGYAGGYVGYVLADDAVGQKRYEALVSWVAPDTGRRVVETALRLQRDLFRDAEPAR